jgi:hypothetical protein
MRTLKRELKGKRYDYRDLENLKKFISIFEIMKEYHEII